MTIDTTKIAPEKLAEMNDSLMVDNNHLRQQLADHIKREVMLRGALRHLWNERTPDSYDEAGEALAATADLDGVILCDAGPFCYLRQTSSDRNPPHGWAVHFSSGEVPLYSPKGMK